ncbi:hypothetical protein Syun_030623 [Stephania yunnanensis]|uniref:Beta-galactosidase galactose-binding domain-containing protein n=1 Tax=Stephania yunnanensis TaxID=152371 RepID=A0AAP0DXJ4_9MAGN
MHAKHQRRRQELTQTTPDQLLDDEAVYYKVAGDCPEGCVYNLRSLWRKKRRYVDPNASTSQVLAQRGMSNFMILRKMGRGLEEESNLLGLKSGEIGLSASLWTYQTYVDAPDGIVPVALDFESMGKGQAWVNGHNIGRFWSLVAPKNGCQETCDYRGAYNENKCAKNCRKLSQKWYHVPRSWLKSSDNLLVIFEETGGNPLGISVNLHYTRTICGSVSESDYPPLHRWTRQSSIHGRTSISNTTPEMQLRCDDGHVISDIVFASYGTPLGSC